ncbi:hypothetical protein HWV62_11233 [Athelia sp. TMB]|nr:hypothetical protein HWV62_11233 [Athelia sp. TMB]
MGVALWLVPPPAERAVIQKIMDSHPPSNRSRSPKSYPHFEPHITLAASLPSSLTPATILASVPPGAPGAPKLRARFKSIEAGDVYFRSVYIDIEASPELIQLRDDIHAKLREHASVHPKAPRFPHMSLYYIDDADAAERRTAAEDLQGQTQTHGGGTLKLGGLSGFDGAEIWVVRCEGPVAEWAPLAKMDY